MRGLLAQAKEARKAAHAHALAGAKASNESANAAHAAITKAGDQLAWTSGDDHFQPYVDLEDAIANYEPDNTVADRIQSLRDITDAAKAALEVGPNEDDEEEDRITDADIAANRPHLKAIIQHAKAAREALRTHAAARREMRSIRGSDWLEKYMRAVTVTKGRHPWLREATP